MEITDRSVYLARLLEWAREKRALYLHAQVNEPFRVRAGGKLETVPPAVFPELDEREMLAGLAEFFGEEFRFKLDMEKEMDFIFSFNNYRYRAHFGKQQEKLYFSIRAVPSQMFLLKDLQLPVSMRQMARDPHGLILFAGPSGHGKGNSARAALQELLDTMEMRVITIEDPIKYVIPNGKSQILQREVGIDITSTSDGLRTAMRENPDVIFVNDLPDPESIDLALTAADRGILVIGIVTARSTWESIDRLRESFEAGQQANFDARFSRAFNTIYFQRMIPNMTQGRTPCVEICRWNQDIARCIKENSLNKLAGYVESSTDEGMHTYDQYLIELHVAGVISRRIVLEYCLNRTYVERVFEKAKKPKPIKGVEE